MKHSEFILVSVLSVTLCGCGGSSASMNPPTPPTPPAPTPFPNVTGNWSLSGISQVAGYAWLAAGHISSTDGSVTGVLHMINSDCFDIGTDVPFTGTVTKAGVITLTSSPVVKQVVSVTGTITSSSLSGGAYTISGGCADGDKGTATGFTVPALTNTYAGNFLSAFHAASDSGTPVKIAIAQSATADAHGIYQVSGTATFESPCFTTGTITSTGSTGSVTVGGFIHVDILTDNNGEVQFLGEVTDSTAKMITGLYYVGQGACAGDSGSGSVSHQ